MEGFLVSLCNIHEAIYSNGAKLTHLKQGTMIFPSLPSPSSNLEVVDYVETVIYMLRHGASLGRE